MFSLTPLFIGSGVAIVTPFNADMTVNYPLFEKLIDFQLANNTDAVVVCGTTGEGATLSLQEREELFTRAVKRVKGRVPVICGVGSNSTSFCLKTSKMAEKCGADALLIVTPYYNKTSQQGLISHYYTLADALDKPMIVYNVPSRTGMNILPETYQALSKHKNIVAVKEADADIGKIIKSMALCGEDLYFYSGNDDLAAPIGLLGGNGTISVLANVLPKVSHALNLAAVNGDAERCSRLQKELQELNDALFCDVNPIPVKYAMQQIGFPVGPCRLPLVSLSKEKQARVDAALAGVKEIY